MTQPANPADPFEFLKSLWTPFGMPVPGVMQPTFDVAELDKRISDLKSVENWLNMNLGVLRMTIQSLEMQKATMAAVKSGIDSARAMGAAVTQPESPQQDAWFDMLRQAREAAEKAGDPKGREKK